MAPTLTTPKRVRDSRIQQNLDLPEVVADYLISRNPAYTAFREDMISAGRLELVEAAENYAGHGFRAWARSRIRNAQRDEVRDLADLELASEDGEKRTWRGRQMLDLDAPTPGGGNLADEIPSSHETEHSILSRIDRRRAIDPDWRKRERSLKGDPTKLLERKDRLTSTARVVWQLRRVKGRGLGATAYATGLTPRQVRDIERRALRIVAGPAPEGG